MNTASGNFRWLIVLAALAAAGQARADLVIYSVPNLPLAMILQGRAKVLPGRTVDFRHPKFGRLIFALENVQIYEVDSFDTLANRDLAKATRTNNADSIMAAARRALHRGMPDLFYDGVKDALAADPGHEDANSVVELKRLIDQPIVESAEEESRIRKLVRLPNMRVDRSKHFILLHDTPDRPTSDHRNKPRSQERLELLELVYESFLLKFYSQGITLEVPKERLMVTLFNDYDDYQIFVHQISPTLQSAAGFFDPKSNVSYFYDQGTHPGFEGLKELSRQMDYLAERSKKNVTSGTKNLVRFANTLSLMVEVAQEDSDIQVVTHEATHQMASNTGLLPRDIMAPSWAHEGLATYFESPNDATWAGIGAVNEERLDMYRLFARFQNLSSLNMIVGDETFRAARSHEAKLFAYGQAWALTHFLMNRHFDKLMTYYRRLGQMPPDIYLSSAVLNNLFDEVFGAGQRQSLDLEWRTYRRSLQTDLEVTLRNAR